MPRSLKRQTPPPTDPYRAHPLPFDRTVAVYYRQSTEGQIGNISTTLQTVDMVEHLKRLGWLEERIRMIDMDAGVSGTKKMQDREGMSQLWTLIEASQVGAVAAQDVDRFFRDMTQIEPNIFIDSCRRNRILVLTPTMVYDFAHPTQGRYHMQQFRDEAQRAADYLEYQIRGKLVKARNYRSERGFWTGRKITTGFIVDLREKLPNGSPNATFAKYVPFLPWAAVVMKYFELFRANEGNLQKTWRQIEHDGPFFPEVTPEQIPEGFKFHTPKKFRSQVTGQLSVDPVGLRDLLVNVAYLGHWVHKDVIVQWNNHEPLVPLDLFMYAFNRISATDFYGNPNENYVPYRPWIRHHKSNRHVEPPAYEGLVFSDDLPHRPHRRLTVMWNNTRKDYAYQLCNLPYKANVWNVRGYMVDAVIDTLLLERLRLTTIDEAAWQAAQNGLVQRDQSDLKRIEQAIKAAKQTKDNLIASLGTLTHPDMVKRAQASYEAADGELQTLQAELTRVTANRRQAVGLAQARPTLERIVQQWTNVPRQERSALLAEFATYVNLTRVSRSIKRLTMFWRDGTTTTKDFGRERQDYYWTTTELELLRQMVESDVDQIEILRAFPEHTWRALKQRYAFKFNHNLWKLSYGGKHPYSGNTKWQNTAEYQAEQAATQLPVTSDAPNTCRDHPHWLWHVQSSRP